ncbi:hypothetical protein [Gimesia maris]|uniref:Leucine Rich repeats (2 copies) n=1 Tax=Gimesia maris TaxID=122 RepID=A0ABX5YFM3_9PLAN|nr:hypothetical protein [Gimesia maris]EDL56917.1 hypothetical protein PM8797T_07362 [Gimesia maris DSM 8797]QEG14531.1 hypothetical protein GmarT_03660 [Gimesia maris]QGQ32052.1 hypothetical protein F1729_27330 [Gimesia maris]
MLHQIAFVAVIAIASCTYAADALPPYGKLTATEELIRREIVRLGGDWESGAKPNLVSFIGDKFESRHCEMLTHLPTLELFYVDTCAIDDFALSCLSQIHQLRRLQIVECKLEPESFSLLRSNRELKEIIFDSVFIPDQLMTELAKLPNLKSISFNECKGITQEQISTLKAALPNVQIGY